MKKQTNCIACNNIVIKKPIGGEKKYCSDECRKKDYRTVYSKKPVLTGKE